MNDDIAVACMAALSDPVRMRIFRYLIAKGPNGAPAEEIPDAIETDSITASSRLGELQRSGLIAANGNGGSLRYAVSIDAVLEMFNYMTSSCCGVHPERCGSFISEIEEDLKHLSR